MDAGWNREDARDAARIQAALRDAGVDRLDFFIASHFHGDHVGGLAALAERVPIGQFIDHGDSVDHATERGRAVWRAYVDTAGDRRRTFRPGDKLPLRGIEFSFVAAHGETLAEPLMPIGPNPHCGGSSAAPDECGENPRSVGYLLSLGAFQLLDFGDRHLLPDPALVRALSPHIKRSEISCQWSFNFPPPAVIEKSPSPW